MVFGFSPSQSCGEPPFDEQTPRLELFSWPWSKWPLYDRIAMQRDRERIERWYAARGFHSTKVRDIRVTPSQASQEDILESNNDHPICQRLSNNEGCEVEITFVIEEGIQTIIQEIAVRGLEKLPPKIRSELFEALLLKTGDGFDEAFYDESSEAMRNVLGHHGYARAEIKREARINRIAAKAWVVFEIEPGPICVFGKVSIGGAKYLPQAPIRAAAGIEKGSRYDNKALHDAQRAIRELGPFSAVTIELQIPEKGKSVDVHIQVTPAREQSVAFGFGVQGGQIDTPSESISVPQWDVHLLGRYRHRNLLGGMRELTIEDQPRMIFQQRFPGPETPRFGNTIQTELRQPGFLEARTTGIANASHSYGPDPYDFFFRHRIDTELALERSFLQGILFTRFALRNSLYFVPSGEERFDGTAPPSDSMLTFPRANHTT
ncbi:MAG: hypothetical protein IPJ88_18565 [Myxococcales bacterium]|nr:MAG: hypothetical protein IPJ88_18565 [Myxococcales bacterium]